MQHHHHNIIVLAVVAIFVWTLCLVGDAYFSNEDGDGTFHPDEHSSQRLLRHTVRFTRRVKPKPLPHDDPSSPRNATTISVHLVDGRINPAYSIFQTNTLRLFGSGRFDYKVEERAQCDHTCKAVVETEAPCLVVSRKSDCYEKFLRCNYPKCKTMLVGDEHCKIDSHDVRLYYSADIPNKAYLPLGPRLDSWQSYQEIRSSADFVMKRASKRQYAFNAIFSQSTNEGRGRLASIIEARRDGFDLPIFTTMPKIRHRDVNNPRYEQLNTHDTNLVMLDSVFTLSPAGHNPECYRLFEAVEAGSIPVLVKDDVYVTDTSVHPCRESLHRWYDAPILILDSWDDLFPTMVRVMNDKPMLDMMQESLLAWYEKYMRGVVAEFEDFMLESSAAAVIG